MNMRGLDTPISQLRKQVFVEVAKVAYESDHVNNDIEAIPYKITPGDAPRFRESIYRERAIASERVRLAMGMSLRPEDQPVHITEGVEESAISDKYYEPPLMQVIPSACNFCDETKVIVSSQCQRCIAHPCMEVCPKQCITQNETQAVIDQSQCIKCGKCMEVCPYNAIIKRGRPCALACGVNAISSDSLGRAWIDDKKCVKCGQCMVSCPFGAIADKSQIFQLIRALKDGQQVIANIAPAFVGQFGVDATPRNVKAALLKIGFSEVYEAALGADIGAVSEAHHYAYHVTPRGDMPFLLTSCCPSWSMLAKGQFPDLKDQVSLELTPMVATARSIKKKHPDSKVVFIGPCAAKKLEAQRKTVRSDVDFVITFEELNAMFEARGIDPNHTEGDSSMHDATGSGRRYAVSGGVSESITNCIHEYYPDVEVKVQHVESLTDCKKVLQLAKAGKLNGYLIEGMGCPGGCIAGAGTVMPIPKAKAEVTKLVAASSKPMPDRELRQIELD